MPDVAIPKEMQLPKGIPPQGHFLALRAQGATVALLPRNEASFLLRGKRICRVLDDLKSPLKEGAFVVISPESGGRSCPAGS